MVQWKKSACNTGDVGPIFGSGRSSGEGDGSPLQYSCLENPTDRGAWWATVCGVTKDLDMITKQQQQGKTKLLKMNSTVFIIMIYIANYIYVCVCVLKNAKFHFLMTTCFCCGSCCSAASHVRVFAAPWAVDLQAPLSMAFSRQEYCDGLPFPFLRDLPEPVKSCLLHCRWILDLWASRKGAIMGLCLCACQLTSAVSNSLQPY